MRSVEVTPTNLWLMKAPILGEITLLQKLKIPVTKAKTVASTPTGVILANKVRTGRKNRAMLRQPNTTSENIIRNRSLIPNY